MLAPSTSRNKHHNSQQNIEHAIVSSKAISVKSVYSTLRCTLSFDFWEKLELRQRLTDFTVAKKIQIENIKA